MHHYGAPTPKPHYAYSNSPEIKRVHKGKLTGWKKKTANEGGIQTCEVYQNKRGETCFKGTKRLRETEKLISAMVCFQNLVYDFHHLIWPHELAIFLTLLCWCLSKSSKSYSKPLPPQLEKLREYPVLFGLKLVDLYTDLTTSAQGTGTLPEKVPSALESFLSMPHHHDGLQYADLIPVYNKHLQIPDLWRPYLPKALDPWMNWYLVARRWNCYIWDSPTTENTLNSIKSNRGTQVLLEGHFVFF